MCKTPTIEIGDRVTNRLIGKIKIGIVVGILYGKYYTEDVKSWDEIYPDWKNDYIIYVKLEQLLDESQCECLIYPLKDIIRMEEVAV